MRVALFTWQIKSITNQVSMFHGHKERTESDKQGPTKGKVFKINYVHVSQPYKIELAKFKGSCLPF